MNLDVHDRLKSDYWGSAGFHKRLEHWLGLTSLGMMEHIWWIRSMGRRSRGNMFPSSVVGEAMVRSRCSSRFILDGFASMSSTKMLTVGEVYYPRLHEYVLRLIANEAPAQGN